MYRQKQQQRNPDYEKLEQYNKIFEKLASIQRVLIKKLQQTSKPF